jgi:hypothetical protein
MKWKGVKKSEGNNVPDFKPVWKEVVHNGDDQIQPIFRYQKHQGTKHASLKMHYLWHNFYLFFSTEFVTDLSRYAQIFFRLISSFLWMLEQVEGRMSV